MEPPIDTDRVRRQLLGLEGPYGDPRVSIDALDDVAAHARSLHGADRSRFAAALVELVTDDDPVAATGAVLALSVVADAADTARLVHLVESDDDLLDRVPVGFSASAHPTIRAELAVVAARSATGATASLVAVLADSPPAGVARTDLVAALADVVPELVVARARVWVGPDDSAVLARLDRHAHRLAVAGAARPWSGRAIDAVRRAGEWQRWHPAELDAVLRVMRDEAPELTRPAGRGVDLGAARWWIVADRHWDWTLWAGDDGRFVLERVRGTVGIWTSLEEVAPDEAERLVAETITGSSDPSARGPR